MNGLEPWGGSEVKTHFVLSCRRWVFSSFFDKNLSGTRFTKTQKTKTKSKIREEQVNRVVAKLAMSYIIMRYEGVSKGLTGETQALQGRGVQNIHM